LHDLLFFESKIDLSQWYYHNFDHQLQNKRYKEKAMMAAEKQIAKKKLTAMTVAVMIVIFIIGGHFNYTLISEASHILTGECLISNCVGFNVNCILASNDCYDGVVSYGVRVNGTLYPAAHMYKASLFECNINSTISCYWDARDPSTVTSKNLAAIAIFQFSVMNIIILLIEIFLACIVIRH
jgi:hypothetical protein